MLYINNPLHVELMNIFIVIVQVQQKWSKANL